MRRIHHEDVLLGSVNSKHASLNITTFACADFLFRFSSLFSFLLHQGRRVGLVALASRRRDFRSGVLGAQTGASGV
jgi:hypothetical protein